MFKCLPLSERKYLLSCKPTFILKSRFSTSTLCAFPNGADVNISPQLHSIDDISPCLCIRPSRIISFSLRLLSTFQIISVCQCFSSITKEHCLLLADVYNVLLPLVSSRQSSVTLAVPGIGNIPLSNHNSTATKLFLIGINYQTAI